VKAAYQFALLLYMPDAIRQEQLNVGVAVALPDSPHAIVRTMRKSEAARLKWLGFKDDLSFLSDVREDLSEVRGRTSVDALRAAHQSWGGTIRVSDLRGALHSDPKMLCDELYVRYVANPRTKAEPGYRDRGVAKRRVSMILKRNLRSDAVRPKVAVPGLYDTHRFDYGLQNGQVLGAITVLSFDAADRRKELQTEIDACAWAISDVRQSEERGDLDITVVTIGPESEPLARAEKIYNHLRVPLIRESEIDSWAGKVADKYPTLRPVATG
jgi:hypothetical protein